MAKESKEANCEILQAITRRTSLVQNFANENVIQTNDVCDLDLIACIQNIYASDFHSFKDEHPELLMKLKDAVADHKIDNLKWMRIKRFLSHLNECANHRVGNGGGNGDYGLYYKNHIYQSNCFNRNNSDAFSDLHSINSNSCDQNGHANSFGKCLSEIIKMSKELENVYDSNVDLNEFSKDINYVSSVFHQFQVKLKQNSETI